MQTYVDSVKPVGVAKADASNGFLAASPTKTAVNFTLSISPDIAENRAAVAAALADLFFRRAAPESTMKLHWMVRAIANAGTVDDYAITAPSADVTAASGHICSMGTITWA